MKAIDECVKDTVEAAKANDYEVIIIADHGNADHALNEDGTPNTAHSLNPVPFVYVTENKNAKVEMVYWQMLLLLSCTFWVCPACRHDRTGFDKIM